MVHRNLLLRANFLPVDEREDCVEPAFDDSMLDCETDESMVDTTLNESEDASNEIVGSAHSPACPLNISGRGNQRSQF